MSNFILGGITIFTESILNFNQDYEEDFASTLLIMADGSGVPQNAWGGKIKTTLSGSGWIPLGLDGLNFNTTLELSCAAFKAINSASNVITLPAARRSDIALTALALVGGKKVPTSVSISTNTATLGVVSGASAYQVWYQPKINVYVTQRPKLTQDIQKMNFGWTFSAREV